jgi:tetratricopeptide (TPR) repeat protein
MSDRFRFDSPKGASGRRRAYDSLLGRWVVLEPVSAGQDHNKEADALVCEDDQEYHLFVEPKPLSETRRRPPRGLHLVAAAGVIGALMVTWWFAAGRWDSSPLTVAVRVETDTVSGSNERSGIVSTAIECGAVEAIASTVGVYALAGRDVSRIALHPQDVMKAVGADRFLGLRVRAGDSADAEVRAEMLEANGRQQWAAEFFVPKDDPALAAQAARFEVSSAFRGRRRIGTDRAYDSASDYAELLRIRESLKSGTCSYEQALRDVRRIRSDSKNLVEAAFLEITMSCYLFKSLGDPGFLTDAKEALAQIESSNEEGTDPRIVLAEADVALASADLGALREAVTRLDRCAPQHPYLARYSARAEEMAGHLPQAIGVLRDAVTRKARWFDLLALADLELKEGERWQALEHLKAAEELAPQQANIKTKRCEAELTYGSPAAAERLILDVISSVPQGHFSVNLGIARLLEGKTEEARYAFNTARELGCELPLLRVYDADTAELLGEHDRAQELYSLAIEELRQPTQAPDPFRQLNLSYCLARIGQPDEALEVLDTAALDSGASPHVAYSAMLIHSLCGRPADASRDETIARAQGLAEPWFELASRLLPGSHQT